MYSPGQSSSTSVAFNQADSAVPIIEPSDIPNEAPSTPLLNGDNAVPGPGPSSRFSRYLSSLAVKPSHDPMLDYPDSELELSDIPSRHQSGSNGMNQAASSASIASLAETPSGSHINPEADSYAYMETLLEALAALGRLGSALDTLTQRVPVEIHALVETTLDEVEERYEITKDLSDLPDLNTSKKTPRSHTCLPQATIRRVIRLSVGSRSLRPPKPFVSPFHSTPSDRRGMWHY